MRISPVPPNRRVQESAEEQEEAESSGEESSGEESSGEEEERAKVSSLRKCFPAYRCPAAAEGT